MCIRDRLAVVPLDYPWEEKTVPLEHLLEGTFISGAEQDIEPYLPPAAPHLKIDAADDAAILSMIIGGMGVSVLSSLSLIGFEDRVRGIPLREPVSYRHRTLSTSKRPAKQRRLSRRQKRRKNNAKKSPPPGGDFFAFSKVSQSSRRRSGANKMKFVFAAACTSQKTLCAERVCFACLQRAKRAVRSETPFFCQRPSAFGKK